MKAYYRVYLISTELGFIGHASDYYTNREEAEERARLLQSLLVFDTHYRYEVREKLGA